MTAAESLRVRLELLFVGRLAVNEMPPWFQEAVHSPLFLAIVGAFVALRNGFLGKPEETPKSERLSAALLCLLGGVYGGPALNDLWHIESKNVQAALIIGCALFGAVVIKAGFGYVRDNPPNTWPFLRNILGGQKQPPKE
jgi:hypothetical protein